MEKEVKKKNSISLLIKFIKDNPRYRALIIMGLYFVFFAIVIAVFSPSNYQTKTPVKKDEPVDILEKYKVLSNYTFEYQVVYIEDEESKHYNFSGQSSNETFQITDEFNNYVFEQDALFQLVDGTIEAVDNKIITYSMNFIPNYIYDLIKKATLKTEIKDYSNETLNKLYNLKIKDSEGEDVQETAIMLISTVESDANIKEVTIYFQDVNANKIPYHGVEEIKIKY